MKLIPYLLIAILFGGVIVFSDLLSHGLFHKKDNPTLAETESNLKASKLLWLNMVPSSAYQLIGKSDPDTVLQRSFGLRFERFSGIHLIGLLGHSELGFNIDSLESFQFETSRANWMKLKSTCFNALGEPFKSVQAPDGRENYRWVFDNDVYQYGVSLNDSEATYYGSMNLVLRDFVR